MVALGVLFPAYAADSLLKPGTRANHKSQITADISTTTSALETSEMTSPVNLTSNINHLGRLSPGKDYLDQVTLGIVCILFATSMKLDRFATSIKLHRLCISWIKLH